MYSKLEVQYKSAILYISLIKQIQRIGKKKGNRNRRKEIRKRRKNKRNKQKKKINRKEQDLQN